MHTYYRNVCMCRHSTESFPFSNHNNGFPHNKNLRCPPGGHLIRLVSVISPLSAVLSVSWHQIHHHLQHLGDPGKSDIFSVCPMLGSLKRKLGGLLFKKLSYFVLTHTHSNSSDACIKTYTQVIYTVPMHV